jgi:sulfoxide reductase heme-binding subunit YedZ
VSGPSPLWYASRGIGLTMLLALTATVVLGTVTSGRWKADGWPRFLTADLHRNLSLIALTLLPLHGLTVVLDSYARLGLTDILVPFASPYRTLWLGLGVLAGELLVAVVATSLVRRVLGYGAWRLVHWAAYAVWPLAVLHGLGTGSDTASGWALVLYIGCGGAVLLAVLMRLALHEPDPSAGRVAAGLLVTAAMLGVIVWTMVGPLQPGWAAAAGTPRDLLSGGP